MSTNDPMKINVHSFSHWDPASGKDVTCRVLYSDGDNPTPLSEEMQKLMAADAAEICQAMEQKGATKS